MSNPEPKEWSNSGLDLFVDFERAGGGGIGVRIEQALRDAIRSGLLAHGTRLPPSRALAADLAVSRGTVMGAYAQLAAEGWIAGRQGSGTRVAVHPEHLERVHPSNQPRDRWRFDLRPGRPDPTSFPRSEWMRALRHALLSTSPDTFGCDQVDGLQELRVALAGYLGRARGLRVDAEQLLITSGFTQALGLVARTLSDMGVRRIAMEEPSMALHRAIVRDAGHELVLLGVDHDGAQIEQLNGSGAGAVVLTPNRQHPIGSTLSPDRRQGVLEWARANDAYVIEDDYDGEFRYTTHSVGPLHGLEPNVVVYAGTASKTLAPSVRLGWVILPPALYGSVRARKKLADWQTATLDQIALAELLRSTAYDRHVRRMRLRYRRRRDLLIETLLAEAPDLEITGAAAGLTLLVPLPDADTEAAALAATEAAGIAAGGLRRDGFYETNQGGGLIIGYAAAAEHTFAQAANALAAVLARPLSARASAR